MTRFPLKTVLFLILTFPSYGQTPPAPATAPGNALKNPGFETQGAGGWLNYNWGPQYGIEWNGTDDHHSGDYALKLIATGQTDDPNGYEMSGAKQVIPVHPGDILEGGVWLKWKD
ncbi:MAG: hypothetical protein JO317_01820, partial [Verrucomicrobiae bacterium]|nr:hypothetical protein [Verrucomicrobiae bacterium]